MNESIITDMVRQECRNLSGDNFEKLKSDIISGDTVCRADNIDFHRFSMSAAVKTVAAAAAFILPVMAVSALKNKDMNENMNHSTQNETIPVTVSQTVSETSRTVSSVTSSETSVPLVCSEILTDISESTVLGGVVFTDRTSVSTGVAEYVTEEIIQKTVNTSVTDQHTAAVTATEEKAYSEQISVSETEEKYTETAVTEKNTEPAASETYSSEPASSDIYTEKVSESVSEDIRQKLHMVPGFTDKLFAVTLDVKKAEDTGTAVYHGKEHDYIVKNPQSYTVAVYDIIIYSFDYLDFLNKGDYILKSETEYSIDEILSADEQLLSIEDLIDAGLAAETIN